MRSAQHHLPEILAVCFVAACIALAVVGWPSWDGASSQAAAAWIQAIFSVVAIGVAIRISTVQYERERQHRLDAEEQASDAKILAIWRLAESGQAAAVDAHRYVAPNGRFFEPNAYFDLRYSARLFDAVDHALGKVPLHEDPYVYFSADILDLRQQLFEYHNSLKRYGRQLERYPDAAPEIFTAVSLQERLDSLGFTMRVLERTTQASVQRASRWHKDPRDYHLTRRFLQSWS